MNWFDPSKPLWLPEGSIRSIIALLFTLAAILLLVTGAGVAEWFTLLLGIIIRDYFAHRQAVEGVEADVAAEAARVEAAK